MESASELGRAGDHAATDAPRPLPAAWPLPREAIRTDVPFQGGATSGIRRCADSDVQRLSERPRGLRSLLTPWSDRDDETQAQQSAGRRIRSSLGDDLDLFSCFRAAGCLSFVRD